MNNIKSGSFYKLLAFALLVLLLVLLAVTAVNGQEQDKTPENSGNDNLQNDNTDPIGDDDDKTPNDQTQNGNELPKIPEYTYYLTGIECSETVSKTIPYAVVSHSRSFSYGISMADMVIEVPLENGETRFVIFYRSAKNLGKIGALAPSRANIDELIDNLGGISVAYGSDNTVIPDKAIDLDVEGTEYAYLENARFVYTSDKMLSSFSETENLKMQYSAVPSIYTFVDFGQRYEGVVPASSVILPYLDENTTGFVYYADKGAYVMQKNGENKTDALNASTVSFTNVFVLFSDATTYEKASGVQTVISTVSSGSGIYFSGGSATEIRWKISESGISFTTLAGDPLLVNRGASYIGYYKSADADDVLYG